MNFFTSSHCLKLARYLSGIISTCFAINAAHADSPVSTAFPPDPLAPESITRFITRSGDKLYDGETEFRYVSVNMPDSIQLITNYQFDGDYTSTRYRLPNEFELRDCVRTVRQLGGRVMRTFTITCRNGDSPDHMFNIAALPAVGNEEALRVIDRLLQICHEEGIRVLIPLVAYKSPIRGDPTTYGDDFWKVGSVPNQKFKSVVTQLINRKNHYTGVAYRDDPAIFGWHTGNELVIGQDADRVAWLHDFAAFLKSIDPHHLVVDGRNRPEDVYPHYGEFLTDDNIDAVSYHTYRNLAEADTPRDTLRLIRNLTRGKKPLLVTEIAMYTPPDALRALLDEIIADGTVGANWWALRYHNRDGGFYKHSDKDSQFEDLNWPGFAATDIVPKEIGRERELLNIMTQYAWKIRGSKVPQPAKPPAPQLLPITDPAHISWQGSTGASSYTIERSNATSGPWTEVASKIGDHLIAYAAQFADTTAVSGHTYYYRIIAHNASGDSPASAPSGPVRADRPWLIDELFDLKHAAADTANLHIDAAYAHTSYLEDIALAVRTDSTKPALLVYRLPSALRSFSATVYDAELVPKLYLVDHAGARREVEPTVATFDGGKRRRLTLQQAGDATTVMLEIIARAAPGQAIGRVEISMAP